MIHGQISRASAPEQAAAPAIDRAFRDWRRLDQAERLRLVEGALRPANDLIDGYPLAL